MFRWLHHILRQSAGHASVNKLERKLKMLVHKLEQITARNDLPVLVP